MSSSNKQWLSNYLQKTEAIVFDFDNTIVDESFSIKNRWSTVLTKYESILNINNLKDEFFRIYESAGESYKFHLDDTLTELNIDKSFKDQILQDFLSQKSTKEFIFPAAIKILHLLHSKNFKLALFTNGYKKTHEDRIKLVKIDHFFDHIQYGDCSLKKPALEGFIFLSESLEIHSKSNFIMIGNSFDEDYKGAKSFGASCILVNSSFINSLNSPCYENIDDFYKDLNKVL